MAMVDADEQIHTSSQLTGSEGWWPPDHCKHSLLLELMCCKTTVNWCFDYAVVVTFVKWNFYLWLNFTVKF